MTPREDEPTSVDRAAKQLLGLDEPMACVEKEHEEHLVFARRQAQAKIAAYRIGRLERLVGARHAVFQALFEHMAGVRDQLIIIEFDDGK